MLVYQKYGSDEKAGRVMVKGVKEVAQSFKSWDTCMDNRVCKIIAIVGIAVGAVIAIWIIGSLLRCFKQGITGICDFLCWPCCLVGSCGRERKKRANITRHQQQAYYAPGYPPQPQVVYAPMVPPAAVHYYGKDEYYSEGPTNKPQSTTPKDVPSPYDLEAQKSKVLLLHSPTELKSPVSKVLSQKHGGAVVYDEEVDVREELLWNNRASQPLAVSSTSENTAMNQVGHPKYNDRTTKNTVPYPNTTEGWSPAAGYQVS